MILHYLKMAWRNLLHYRAQAVISVAGLAAGFVCFTLANLWRVYETTYDTSYEGADRMYVCCMKTDFMESGYFDYNVYPLATWLKTTCPEVEQAAAIDARLAEMDLRTEDGTAVKGKAVMADSCFLQLFGIQILKGTDDFLRGGDRVALTESMARRLYGTTDVLGRKLTYQNTQASVCALVSSLEHTNFPYDILTEGNAVISNRDNWRMASFFIIVKLRQGVSAQEFQQKLADRVERNSDDYKAALGTGCYLCPLSEYRTSPMCRDSEIELGYLSLFAFIGGLVIVCALVNYLALFLTRLRIRSREIALRRVCGSSRGGVFLLLLTEYMLLLLLAGLVGMALVELFLPPFRRLSGVEGDVYGMSLLYFAGLVGVSVLFLLPVAFRRTPDGGGRRRDGLSCRLAVGMQMAVGILFIFCMSVLMKQLHYLRHTDFGWTRAERAVLTDWNLRQSYEPVADFLSAQPCVRYVARHCHGYFPASVLLNTIIEDWEGRQGEEVISENLTFGIDSTLMDFHGLELLEGRLPLGGRDEVVVNEAAARRLGWGGKAVGRWLKAKYGPTYTVVGLLRDFQASAPTVPVRPTLFVQTDGLALHRFGDGQILIRYREGTWEELKRKTEEYFATHYPDERYDLYNLEDLYTGQYLQSELLLLKLLGFASVACVLISAFGIYSMVTLSCERRRKEIAIRKVNGARVGDILRMFVREYLVLLLLASVPAFLAGYVLMRRWMERYVEQCAIPWWMYLAIFAGVASVVALCIGSRVWKAARQNPAEVIKSE